VVIATGPFQTPRVPSFASDLAPHAFQTHSRDYRRPSDLPHGTVLVVGGGNTGYEIAAELSATSGPPRHWRTPNAATSEARRPRPVLVA
jgi:putative flavoprotein involved in K+ transport